MVSNLGIALLLVHSCTFALGRVCTAPSVNLEGCVTVDYTNQAIGDAGALALAQSLASGSGSETVATLILYKCGIGPVGAAALAEAVRAHPRVTAVNLNSNAIEDAGVASVAAVLAHSASLLHLELDTCGVTDAGATRLAMGLVEIGDGGALLTLDLGGNVIGDSGATALAGALRANHVLRKLELGGNHIGDAGAKALAGSLTSHNQGLTHLGLSYNSRISAATMEHVEHGLAVRSRHAASWGKSEL